jgi:outer membrane biogenesis lipoprotein LolB
MSALRLFLVFAVAALLFTGCKTTEPENLSERPWNAQQGWQTGLPSTINQGR